MKQLAATEAQMQAMQEAQDIDTDVDTRTKEEMVAEQMAGLGSAGKTAVESVPGVGEAMLAKEVADYIGEGSYGSAAIGTAALGVGMIPGAGDVLAKPIRVFAKKFRKADEQDAKKFLDDPDTLQAWRDDPSNQVGKAEKKRRETRKYPEQAQALESGLMSGPEYRRYIRENQPATKFTLDDLQTMVPTFKDTVGALGKSKASKGIVGLNKKIEKGTIVDSRLDIPAYNKYNTWVASMTLPNKAGNVYGRTAVLKDVDFSISTSTEKVRKIAKDETSKFPMATMKGEWQDLSDEDAFQLAQKYLADPKSGYVQVGFNPERHSFFYDKDTMMPIFEAEEVVQIGALVLAKPKLPKTAAERAARIGKLRELKIENTDRVGRPATFNEGGAVMQKQMEMFDDGGLMDEGGTVDPVSGNDVPPGSTQEEVRDDIPAQLSEGEFVFPADVVRYIGLGNLMRMRQEAKMGLKLMDQMGQMGNSEEATMPDDLPFDINDLDMEDEIDDNNELEMQVGGFVQPTQQQQQMGISGYQQAAAPTTGVAAVPQQAASQQYVQPVQPVQAAVPTMQAYKPEEVPTFQQTIGDDAFGTYDELRQYRNEAGNIINVPFRNGQPISPIPEGYTFVDPEETATEEVTTTPVTTETTQVREPESNKDDRPEPRGAVFALGTFSENGRMGGKEGEDYFNFNVSFDTRKEGSIPGTMGVLGLAAGLATGKGLPEGTIATLEYDGTEMKVGAKEYNAAREDRYGDKAQELIQRFKEKRDNEIKAAKALAEEYGLKYTGQTLAEMAKATNAIDAENKRKEAQERADVLAAQKLKDEKAKQAELDRVAREREQRAIYGGGDGGGGTSGRGYSVGRQTGLGEGATPGGYGGTGRGRSDAPGNSASSNRSSRGSGGSFDSRGGRGRFGGNEGGLASKPKPKTKKMKKGGLASKK